MAEEGALAPLRVIEIGHFLAGPFCAQILADFGADVIKIESPTGDATREWGAVRSDDGQGIWFSVVGRGKRSIVLDLKCRADLAVARELLGEADVLIENHRPGVMERLGLGVDELQTLNPRLVIGRVSGWGQTGPYSERAGFGAVAESFGGLRYVTGDPDRRPTREGISIGDSLAGAFTTIGVLCALRERERSGRGQVVDTAIYEAVMAMMESALAESSVTGLPRERTGSLLPSGAAPNNIYLTADGRYIAIAANGVKVFPRLAEAMGRPELASDPRFATHAQRGDNTGELDALIEAWTAEHELAELDDLLGVAGVPAGPVNSTVDLLSHHHVAARAALVTIEDPVFGELRMQGPVPKLSRTPGSVRGPAPLLGEHGEEVLAELRAARPSS